MRLITMRRIFIVRRRIIIIRRRMEAPFEVKLEETYTKQNKKKRTFLKV